MNHLIAQPLFERSEESEPLLLPGGLGGVGRTTEMRFCLGGGQGFEMIVTKHKPAVERIQADVPSHAGRVKDGARMPRVRMTVHHMMELVVEGARVTLLWPVARR